MRALARFPITLFTAPMGMIGLGLAWREAAASFDLPAAIGEAVIGFGSALYVAILVLYIVKAVRFPAAAAEDCRDAVRVNFLPAITMSLILVSIGAAPHDRTVGEILWCIGAAANVAITVYVVVFCWYGLDHVVQSVTPAWFIPVVGNLVAPIGGAYYGYYEISWMIFGVGVFFWLILSTILFYRLLFHEPMAAAMKPTMAIQLAPPGLIFIAYTLLNQGYVDAVGLSALGVGFLFTLMLASRIADYLRLPFGLGWWAYTFPTATMAGATLIYHSHAQSVVAAVLALAYLAAATLIVALVLALTLRAAFRGEILTPPPAGPPGPAATERAAAERTGE